MEPLAPPLLELSSLRRRLMAQVAAGEISASDASRQLTSTTVSDPCGILWRLSPTSGFQRYVANEWVSASTSAWAKPVDDAVRRPEDTTFSPQVASKRPTVSLKIALLVVLWFMLVLVALIHGLP